MPKGGKSSASSATRKKHAKKAAQDDVGGGGVAEPGAAPPAGPPRKAQRGQKLSKAQRKALPKVKQYVPPPRAPAPPIPDPLDARGLARSLPAELVVVLRRLGKKDGVTRRRGLDELRDWIGGSGGSGEVAEAEADPEVARELREATLEAALPVWMHNLASLLQSPFHRTAALAVHAELAALPAVRAGIVDALALGLLPGTQGRDVLGSWMVAALEEGRRAGGAATRCWEATTTLSRPVADGAATDGAGPAEAAPASAPADRIDLAPHLAELAEYLSLSILDPQTLHADIHPVPVASAPPTPAVKPAKGGKARAPPPPAPVAAPTPDEDAEVADERWARYRIGGLVGLASLVRQLAGAGYAAPPPQVAALLQNPLLWSALAAAPTPVTDSPIGSHPPIRRAAYAMLATLIDVYPQEVAEPDMLRTLADAVLGSCWAETESVVWETAGAAVVKLLTKYPQSWDMPSGGRRASVAGTADSNEAHGDDEGDRGDEEGSEDEDEDEEVADGAAPAATPTSPAFTAFLDFVSTICPALAAQTYPLLLLVVSSLPPSILPLTSPPSLPLQTLFSHLFAPLDARLLTTHALPAFDSPFQSFLYAAIDISTFVVARTHADSPDTARWVAAEQMGRAWREGVVPLGGRKRGKEVEAEAFGKALAKIAAMSAELAAALVGVVDEATLGACFAHADGGDKAAAAFLPRVLAVLDALRDANTAAVVVDGVDRVIGTIASRSTEALERGLAAPSTLTSAYAETVTAVLQRHGGVVSSETVSTLASLLQRIPELGAALAPSTLARLCVALLQVASDAERKAVRDALWRYVDSDAPQDVRFALVGGFVAVGGTSAIEVGAFDRVLTEATEAALHGAVGAEDIVRNAIGSDGWLSENARHTVLALVCSAVHSTVDVFLSDDMSASTAPIDLLAAYAADLHDLLKIDIYVSALISVHRLVSFLPQRGMVPPPAAIALWDRTKGLGDDDKAVLQGKVRRALKEALTSIDDVADTTVDVAVAYDIGQTAKAADIADALLPSADDIAAALRTHTARTPDPALNIVDPLVPCADNEDRRYGGSHDAAGRSEAARVVEALLALTKLDRQLIAGRPALVRAVAYALALARDHAAVGDSRGLYATAADPAHVRDVVQDAEAALSFALSGVDERVQWHAAAAESVKGGKRGGDWVQDLLVDIGADAAGDVGARAFREILSRQLRQSGAGEAEAEVWLQLAMASISSAPNLALAIMHAVKPLLLDSKALELAQNRLANALTGIAAAQASARGLPLLRLLLASAPPADSASLFLPQNRALFVLRHVATWLASDAELADELEPRLAELHATLAPVVQDVAGAHWDTLFDLLDAGLEVGLEDKTAWPFAYWALRLLVQVRDLCATNKSLRASWTGKDAQMGLVVKVFLQCRSADSEALQMIHALVLDLLPDVPETVMEQASLPDLAALVRDSTSAAIQCAAYRILARVIRSQTLALVLDVEAAVSDEPTATDVRLPAALVDIVERGRGVDWAGEGIAVERVLGQLLAWMAILDHFDDASRTLRWAYLDQLNGSRLLEESLLPLLFAMLGVSEVGAWNFGASQYAVDEFYTDLLQPEELADLTPLGSHVFFRLLTTVPTSMRAYYTSLKSRQLSLSLLGYVARHYSPVIIAHEFSALRAPAALAQLADEGLAVKVVTGGGGLAGATAAEAIASYVVDEQPMEIGIRLPAEFPLKAVEIRDLRRVGVPENKWRGWLMGVQQTITSRNGLILEALTVFKKNVALHFEGVVECAICYSIISLTDRTLPTKPCRTCKNRFHASCLFKWFNSSHSSSCPLCRSLF